MGHYDDAYERAYYKERLKREQHLIDTLKLVEDFRSDNIRNKGLPPYVEKKLNQAIRWLKSELYTRRD